jgi:hypothetical protein
MQHAASPPPLNSWNADGRYVSPARATATGPRRGRTEGRVRFFFFATIVSLPSISFSGRLVCPDAVTGRPLFIFIVRIVAAGCAQRADRGEGVMRRPVHKPRWSLCLIPQRRRQRRSCSLFVVRCCMIGRATSTLPTVIFFCQYS